MDNINILEEFMKIVSIDAFPRNERDVADYVINELRKLSYYVEEDDAGEKLGGNTGNIYAVKRGNTSKSLMISAHLDRVENGLGIRPRILDGKIVSSGDTILAADDIAGVAAILYGIRKAEKELKDLPTIELVFTVCEERGLLGAKEFDCSRITSKEAYVLDGTGDFGRIINQSANKALVQVEFFGRAAHAGMNPEKGVNAIFAAFKCMHDLKEGRLDFDATSNFGSILGGADNIGTVCDYVKLRAEARNLDLNNLLSYIDYVDNHIKDRIGATGAEYKLSYTIDYKGFKIDEDHHSIRKLKKIISQLGYAPRVEFDMAGFDANLFNEKGVLSIPLAMGYQNPHSKDEYIKVDHLIAAGELVYKLIGEYSLD